MIAIDRWMVTRRVLGQGGPRDRQLYLPPFIPVGGIVDRAGHRDRRSQTLDVPFR